MNVYSMISFKQLQRINNDIVKRRKYSCSNSIIHDITQMIYKHYENDNKIKQKSIQTKINQAIYLIIAISNFNFLKKCQLSTTKDDEQRFLIHKKYVNRGNTLSKEILTNVITNKDLYLIKRLLIENNIIQPVEYHKKKISPGVYRSTYYSARDKKAISYRLNKKYVYLTDLIDVNNKYADKHLYLQKHLMLFGNRKKTINPSFLPYQNVQKNLQYMYQKNMSIDIDHVINIICKEYKQLNNIQNISGQIKAYFLSGNLSQPLRKFEYISQIIPIFSAIKQFNTHIFRATEAYGRIYMPLHTLKSKYRECVRFGENNEEIEQIYDIKCCFVQLSARLALKDAKTNEQKTEIFSLLSNIKNDIYSDILKYSETDLNRQQIKKQILAWLFENKLQRIFNTNKIHNIISNYFRQKYPFYYKWVVFYNSIQSTKTYKNKKHKTISKLSIDCFKHESELIFDNIFPYLHKIFPNIEFISLHDGIFITKSKCKQLKLTKIEFSNLVNKLIQKIFENEKN